MENKNFDFIVTLTWLKKAYLWHPCTVFAVNRRVTLSKYIISEIKY